MTDRLHISRDLSLPLAVAGEAIGVLATRGAGKSYTSAVLVEELHDAGVQLVVLDPTGVYWGLRSSASGKGEGLPLFVLGGAHGDVPLESSAGKLVADVIVDTGQSLILDLSDFETKAAQTRFVADLIERLFHRKARSRSTLHVVVDEANEFAPQQSRYGGDMARLLGAMERAVGKGRSRGLAFTLITQRSAALNKNVLDLIDTLIVMRVLGPRDRRAISDWIVVKQADDRAGVVDSLPSLPTGTAFVWSPVRDILKKVAIRRIKTFDSYRTPEPGEERVEPSARAPLDVEALGEKMRATAERAKAEDPRELQGKIRNLEARIAEMERAEPKTVESVVERIVREPYIPPAIEKLVPELLSVQGDTERAAVDLKRITDTIAGALKDLPSQPAEVVPIDRPARPRPYLAPAIERATKHVARDFGDRLGAEMNGELSKGERAFLGILAQYPQGRSKSQLATLAGYSPRSGGNDTILAELRKKGAVDGSASLLVITERGREIIGDDYEPLPTGAELRSYWVNNPRLSSGAKRFLSMLIDAYPASVSKADLAEAAGYSPKSGGNDTILADLRKRDLITGSAAALRASDDLFQ